MSRQAKDYPEEGGRQACRQRSYAEHCPGILRKGGVGCVWTGKIEAKVIKLEYCPRLISPSGVTEFL
jgi:hypothetical protein